MQIPLGGVKQGAVRTSESTETPNLVGGKDRSIGEELAKADGLVVPAVLDEFVEQLECREQVILP